MGDRCAWFCFSLHGLGPCGKQNIFSLFLFFSFFTRDLLREDLVRHLRLLRSGVGLLLLYTGEVQGTWGSFAYTYLYDLASKN